MIDFMERQVTDFMSSVAAEHADMPRGVTPRKTVMKAGNMELLRFDSPKTRDSGEKVSENSSNPVLFVPSLINRWYILDLTETTTFTGHLAKSRDCYLVDWGYPGAESSHLPLSHFYHRSIKRCIRAIRRETGAEKVDLIGYCIGGTLAYLYSCLEPDDIGNLVLLTAPIDFDDAGIFGLYAEDFPSEEIRSAMDYMPGWLLGFSFQFVQPMGLLNKTKMFFKNFENEKFKHLFVAMERWLGDPVHFPGQSYYELLTHLYKENRISRETLTTGTGERIDPSRRTSRLFVVTAENDHIAPAPCAALPPSDGAHRTAKCYPTGHIGITVGKFGNLVKTDVEAFLDGKDMA